MLWILTLTFMNKKSNEEELLPQVKARFFEGRNDPSYGYSAKGTSLYHNRKTGKVVSSTHEGAEFSNSEPHITTSPSKHNKNLETAAKARQSQKERLK